MVLTKQEQAAIRRIVRKRAQEKLQRILRVGGEGLQDLQLSTG